jgi:glycosyltransferase involved in cell wall biosynthesis
MNKPSVSIFFPCYNDWGTMASMVLLTSRTAKRLGLDYDITIVDDGSGEHTLQLLEEIEMRLPETRVVRHPANRGYGGALRTGFASATREWIFYTDGDAQYDVRELEALLKHVSDDVDIVQGYKIARGDPLHRKIIGRVYHWGVKLAFGLPYRDVDCDFRLIRRSVFDRIVLRHDSGVICVEMMAKINRAGFRYVEAPVHHFERSHGISQFFNFTRIARTLWNLGGLWVKMVLLRKEA